MAGRYCCGLAFVNLLLLILYMITLNTLDQALQHGGDIEAAAQRYDIELEHWVDLSTGISPWAWSLPSLPERVWQSLPPTDLSELLTAAAAFYQCSDEALSIDNISVTPGSQLLIRLLPHIADNIDNTPSKRVALPLLGYQEHALSWHMAGFELVFYQNVAELDALIQQNETGNTLQHAVVINPNNPSTELIDATQIKNWAEQLPGLMIVDEAFIDLQPQLSSIQHLTSTRKNNLVVLRSFGKFFGLAGLRVGFITSNNNNLLKQVNALFHPWSINHAALLIAQDALCDHHWQQQQRQRIAQQSEQLGELLHSLCDTQLSDYGLQSAGLFTTIIADRNELKQLHQQLAQQAIWTRFCGDTHSSIQQHLNSYNSETKDLNMPAWLRFSLPGDQLKELQHRLDSL